jgi:hypothetical protein
MRPARRARNTKVYHPDLTAPPGAGRVVPVRWNLRPVSDVAFDLLLGLWLLR